MIEFDQNKNEKASFAGFGLIFFLPSVPGKYRRKLWRRYIRNSRIFHWGSCPWKLLKLLGSRKTKILKIAVPGVRGVHTDDGII